MCKKCFRYSKGHISPTWLVCDSIDAEVLRQITINIALYLSIVVVNDKRAEVYVKPANVKNFPLELPFVELYAFFNKE